jgi:hypothetical protein
MTSTRNLPPHLLLAELRAERAEPYRRAAATLGRQADRLDLSDPQRKRLQKLAEVARARARAIEDGA